MTNTPNNQPEDNQPENNQPENNQPENDNQDNTDTPNFLNRIISTAKHPSTIIIGITLIGIGVVGVIITKNYLQKEIPSIAEKQLSNILNREVNVGEVKKLSLNNITIGETTIPPTNNDSSNIQLDSIKVDYNIFPLIFKRTLPLRITIINPDINLSQHSNGNWINLDSLNLPQGGGGKLPITIDANVNIEDGDIILIPHNGGDNLNIKLNSNIQASTDLTKPIQYDVAANIEDGKANIKGETTLKTWQTKATANIEKLPLISLNPLLVNTPITFNNGELNTDLNMDFPSLENIESTTAQGFLNLTNLEVGIESILQPLKANILLNFEGEKINFKEVKSSLGEIEGNVTGGLNWQEGYKLDINIPPFNLKNLTQLIKNSPEVEVGGEIKTQLDIMGEIKNPLIKGSVNNTSLVNLDKVKLSTISSDFQGNLSQILLESVKIIPEEGGEININGLIETNILNSLENNQPIDIGKMPLAFNFNAQLPTEKIVKPYYSIPSGITVGEFKTEGKIQGTLNNPEGNIKLEILSTSGKANEVFGGGEINLEKKKITVENTIFKILDGFIKLDVNADLESKDIEASINSESVKIHTFLSTIDIEGLDLDIPIILNNADIKLTGKLDVLSLDNLDGLADINLTVGDGNVIIDSILNSGNLEAIAKANQIPISNFLPNISTPITLVNSNFNLTSNLPELVSLAINPEITEIKDFNANGNLFLKVNNGNINAKVNINPLTTEITAKAIQIPLENFLPTPQEIPIKLIDSDINILGNTSQFLSVAKNREIQQIAELLDNINANINTQLTVKQERINAFTQLNNGILEIQSNTGTIPINALVDLPLPVTLINSKINLLANVSQILSFATNPTPEENTQLLNQLDGNADIKLAVADGIIHTIATLNNNTWQAEIGALNINSSLLINQLLSTNYLEKIKLGNINGNLNLSGNINSLFQPDNPIPIEIALEGDIANQSLSATGDIILDNLLSNPDISNLELDLIANSKLDSLPVNQVITTIPINQQFLPQQIQLQGEANFQGKLTGKNLLTTPLNPGNILLTGDLELKELVFNNINFESLLAGKVNISPREELTVNLEGNQDILATMLIPCNQENCISPYLPNYLYAGFQSPINQNQRVVITGKRQRDIFSLDMENFPLQLFRISPARNFGIPGFLTGLVNIKNTQIDLFTLEGEGEITIDNPGVGDIQANQIAADFSYQDNIAEITSATLTLGNSPSQSKYNLNGNFNLETGAIDGKLILAGNVENILQTLNIYSIDSIIALIQQRNNGKAAQIQNEQIAKKNISLGELINLLWEIDRQIEKNAASRDTGRIPTQINIRGDYDGEVNITGNIRQPNLDFQLQGKDWYWQPQASFPDIVKPLGLVIRDSKPISIDRILVDGNVAENKIVLDALETEIEKALFSLEGSLSAEKGNGNFEISNLSLDTIKNFINIPLDIDANINLKGKVDGNITNPQLQGNLIINETAFNGRVLNQDIKGDFTYNNGRLIFNTNDKESIQISTNLVYPPTKEEQDSAIVNLQLDTETLELLGIFSQNLFQWVNGEGNVNLEAKVPSLTQLIQNFQEFSQQKITLATALSEVETQGEITLENTILKTPLFENTIGVNGKISIEDEDLIIDSLTSNFANSNIGITGSLPIFEKDNDNALNINIQGDATDLQGFYRGKINGNVKIEGSIEYPKIGGRVELYDGTVFIPQTEGNNGKTNNPPKPSNLNSSNSFATNQLMKFIPQLNNLNINLIDIRLQQLPLYNFLFSGNLSLLEGRVNELKNIDAQGIIQLQRAEVNVINTDFNLSRSQENTIVFVPQQGLLNPNLDIQLETVVTEPEIQTEDFTLRNEIRDDIFQSGRSNTIKVFINIDGKASQILPALARDTTSLCQIRTQDSLPVEPELYPENKVEKIENCINISAFTTASEQDLGILTSSIVELSSTPGRSQGEIIRLLAGQLLTLIETLQDADEEELLQFGFFQFVAQPVLSDIIYQINGATSDVGGFLGMDDLILFPEVEGIYKLDDRSSVNLNYDYTFNEFQIRYLLRF